MESASQLFVLDQSNQLLWRMHLVKRQARYVDRNACSQNKLEMTSDNLKAASSTVSSVQEHHPRIEIIYRNFGHALDHNHMR